MPPRIVAYRLRSGNVVHPACHAHKGPRPLEALTTWPRGEACAVCGEGATGSLRGKLRPDLPAAGVDRSTSETVVEYAVQYLMKGKTIGEAARATAKKLSGHENMFLGPGVTLVSPALLERALWGRLVESAVRGATSFKAGKEHFALDGTLAQFHQDPALRPELKRLVIQALGRDPFTGDAPPVAPLPDIALTPKLAKALQAAELGNGPVNARREAKRLEAHLERLQAAPHLRGDMEGTRETIRALLDHAEAAEEALAIQQWNRMSPVARRTAIRNGTAPRAVQ